LNKSLPEEVCLYVTPWCNGSTTGFDPVSRGSSPRGVTI
jgi:hypothetical protein